MKKISTLILLALLAIVGKVQAVTPPADAEQQEWSMTTHGASTGTEMTYSIFVAVSGNDFYVQRLSGQNLNAWVVGTLADGTLTIEPQSMGTRYTGENYIALNFSGATFVLDEATGRFYSEDGYYTKDELGAVFDDYKQVTLTPPADADELLVPGDPRITGFPYGGRGYFLNANVDACVRDAEGQNLNTDNLYFQVWTDVEHDIEPYVIPAAKHSELSDDLALIPYSIDGDDIYVWGGTLRIYFNDDETVETWNRVGIQAVYKVGDQTATSNIVWRELKAFTTEEPSDDELLTPAAPAGIELHESTYFGKYIVADVSSSLTSVDGKELNTDHLYFSVWTDVEYVEQIYVIPASLHTGWNSDMSQIPYGFHDQEYDIYFSDDDMSLFFNDDQTVDTWNRVGLQAVYKVNGEQAGSEIVWLDLKPYTTTGISAAQTAAQTVASFDLQGRQVKAGAKGLLLRQVKTADGRVKTVKTVVK